MNRTSIAIALGLALGAAPLAAQAPAAAGKPGSIGVMGGLTFPRGSDASDLWKKGWNAGVLIRLGAPPFPLSFRLEGQWHQLGGKTIEVPDFGTVRSDLRVIDGTADFEWTLGPPKASNFYLIGGVGFYKLRSKNTQAPTDIGGSLPTEQVDQTVSTTAFGWNGGAGVRFQVSGHTLFIEGRYHSVNGSRQTDFTGGTKEIRFIPLDVGITI